MIYLKTLQEIELIRKSSQIVAEVLRLLGSYIKPGVTTYELDQIAEDYIRANDAIPAFKGYSQGSSMHFPATICASPDNVVVHGIPDKQPLVEGQILSIDVGVKRKSYYGDGAYTFPVGEVSDDKKRLMEVTKESLRIGIENSIAGNRINDISASIEKFVNLNNFSVVKDLCGHGVGKFLHEDPSVPNYKVREITPKLKNRMTIAIEPMVNFGDWRINVLDDGWSVVTADSTDSAHFEHTILINENKPEILTI
jgi:methionyl aminopeptidase